MPNPAESNEGTAARVDSKAPASRAKRCARWRLWRARARSVWSASGLPALCFGLNVHRQPLTDPWISNSEVSLLTSAATRFMESLLSIFRMHWGHEPGGAARAESSPYLPAVNQALFVGYPSMFSVSRVSLRARPAAAWCSASTTSFNTQSEWFQSTSCTKEGKHQRNNHQNNRASFRRPRLK